MNDHCKFESDIAVLKEIVPRIEGKIDRVEGILSEKIQNNLTVVQQNQIDVTKTINDLARTIKGANSDPGLTGVVAVVRTSVKRLWWFVGIIVVALLGGVAKIFFS